MSTLDSYSADDSETKLSAFI